MTAGEWNGWESGDDGGQWVNSAKWDDGGAVVITRGAGIIGVGMNSGNSTTTVYYVIK